MAVDFVRVRPDTPIRGAHALLRSANMRDLVVMDGGRLAGVVSQLDLYLLESLRDADPESALVEEAMAPQPYVVAPDVSVGEVARTMLNRRCGAAVVVDRDEVIGIFTHLDALRALAEVLVSEGDEERSVVESAEDAAQLE
jgi:CBS domain-containing protein